MADLLGNSVSVTSTVTNAVITTVPVHESPQDVAVTPDGALAYVTSLAGTSVINTATNNVVGQVPGPALGVAISSAVTPPLPAPTSSTSSPSTSTPTAAGNATELPTTGANTAGELIVGGTLIGAGALTALRRRERKI